MKKIIASLLIGFILGAGLVWNFKPKFQSKRNPDTHFKRMLEKFNSKLDLNAQQKEQVSDILKENRKKFDAMREDAKPKFEALRQETRDRISAILNPDQKKKYDILEAEMNSRRKKDKRP